MSEKEQIIKDSVKFTSARYFSQGVGFFTAIAMRRFLGPFYMGIWSLLNIVTGYLSYLMLGVDSGASNRIPYLEGQKDLSQEEEVTNSTFGFMLIVSVLSGVGLLIGAFVLRKKYPIEVIVGLGISSLLFIFGNFCSFYQILLRAKHNFSVLSKAIVFESLINLALIVFLVSRFKIYGLYAVVIMVAISNLSFMHYFARYHFRFSLNYKKTKELIGIGFPIMIVGLLQWVLGSLDRIMIAKMLGVVYVGFYSIPIMAKNYVGQLAGFGTVLYPRLMKAYGENNDIDDIKKYVMVPTIIIAYMLPAILGVIFFVTPVLVVKVLPQYVQGILAMQILLIEMFFAASYALSFHFICAVGKQARVIPIILGAIVLNVIGNYSALKMGYGICGVAWATSAVTFLGFITMQSYAMKHFSTVKEISLFLLKVLIPLVYTTAIVLLLHRYIVVGNIYLEVFLRCGLFAVFYIPLLVFINTNTGIIDLVIGVIKNKRRKMKEEKNEN